jgi:hypothetical protein
MALHLIFQPHAGNSEPIERPNAASIRKLMAEGQMAEQMIFLGWEIDTRRLQITLPKEKAQAWSKSIKLLTQSNSPVTYQSLATLVG